MSEQDVKFDVQCLWEANAQLGEGPLWVAEQNRLYFVDLKNQALHALDATSGARRSWAMPDYICWLVARRDGDGFMAGLRDGIARVWLEPELRIDYLHRPFPAGSGLRMNDAKADSAGRIWAGSMHNTDYAQAIGLLFRLDADLSLTVADDGYHICNGPAFSNDGATMYHTDSYEGRTYAYPLAADGTPGAPRLWRQFGEGEGSPDGMTVDSEGLRVDRAVGRRPRVPLLGRGRAAGDHPRAGAQSRLVHVRWRRLEDPVHHHRARGQHAGAVAGVSADRRAVRRAGRGGRRSRRALRLATQSSRWF